jgi:hypothetical protein
VRRHGHEVGVGCAGEVVLDDEVESEAGGDSPRFRGDDREVEGGPPLSLRSIPNTSQMTPNSNGAVPGMASRAIFLSNGTPWQKILDIWRSCHWWLNSSRHRFSAMFLLMLIVAVIVASTVATMAQVSRDGYRKVEYRPRR